MDRSQKLHQEISIVAYEIYEKRGAYGLELENWLEAERIVIERFSDQASSKVSGKTSSSKKGRTVKMRKTEKNA
jgi:hypothetical protein